MLHSADFLWLLLMGGCDIIKEMYENGELKKIFEDKGIKFKQ